MPNAVISTGDAQTAQDTEESDFNQLLFKQELNEIYLLLDFVAGRPDKHLNDLKEKIPKRAPAGSGDQWMSTNEIVEFISTLRYPPSGDAAQKSEQAATLLLVKDALNSIAYPARGLTIAYTTLFTDSSGSNNGRPALAKLAYPALVGHAKWFRRFNNVLVASGVGFTMLAAGLLWHLTYGVQLTARFDEAKRADTASAAKVFDQLNSLTAVGARPRYDILDTCRSRRAPDQASTHGGGGGQAADSAGEPVAPPPPSGNVPPVPQADTSAVQLACAEYAFKHAQLCVTVADFNAYAQSRVFALLGLVLPTHKPRSAETCDLYPPKVQVTSGAHLAENRYPGTIHAATTDDMSIDENRTTAEPARQPPPSGSEQAGRQEDAVSIAGVLQVTSNSLLPMLFGLCGALVSYMRNIQTKINGSLLVPRDRALTVIRIPLGLVAGVCVGLFFSPDGASKGASGIGGFSLTASGIAFLAGYGAEAFFRTLDTAVERIFVADEAAKAKA